MTPIGIRHATVADADDPALLQVLRAAVSDPRAALEPAMAGGLCLVAHGGGRTLGCVCLSRRGRDGSMISAVAVAVGYRRSGIGRRLVTAALERAGSRWVEAETDGDAVDFYRELGFSVRSLGEKYPGVERFACRWIRRPGVAGSDPAPRGVERAEGDLSPDRHR